MRRKDRFDDLADRIVHEDGKVRRMLLESNDGELAFALADELRLEFEADARGAPVNPAEGRNLLVAHEASGDPNGDIAAWLWTHREELIRCAEESHQLAIRAGEARSLLQRMAKYVREDNAVTSGTTRLARLTAQVTDYLRRTHDPRILRSDEP